MMNIDTAVCILCQTQFLSTKRNAVPEFDEVSRLVQCCIGHGYLWWRGLMTGLLREKTRHLPSPFRATFRLNENRTKLVCVMSSVRKVG